MKRLSEFMNQLAPAQFAAGLVALVLLVLAGLYTVGVRPAQSEQARLQAELKAIPITASQETGMMETSAQIRARLDAVETALYGTAGANQSAEQLEADVIEKLQDLSWRTQVDLRAVRPAEGDVVDGFLATDFSIRVTGRYQDLYQWLQGLDQDLGFVVIKDYRMAPVGALAGDDIAVELTLATYRSAAG